MAQADQRNAIYASGSKGGISDVCRGGRTCRRFLHPRSCQSRICLKDTRTTYISILSTYSHANIRGIATIVCLRPRSLFSPFSYQLSSPCLANKRSVRSRPPDALRKVVSGFFLQLGPPRALFFPSKTAHLPQSATFLYSLRQDFRLLIKHTFLIHFNRTSLPVSWRPRLMRPRRPGRSL